VALPYLERAAAQAFETAADEETIALVTDALTLVDQAGIAVEPRRRARWLLWRAFGFVRSQKLVRGNDDVRAGLRLLGYRTPETRAAVTRELASQLLLQAVHLAIAGRPAPAGTSERDDARLASLFYHRYLEVQWSIQKPLWSFAGVARALNIADRAGDEPEAGITLANAGFWCAQLGLRALSKRYYERGRRLVERDGQSAAEGYYALSRSTCALSLGEWREAAHWIDRGIEAHRRIGDKGREEAALRSAAAGCLLQGDYEGALGWLDRAAACFSPAPPSPECLDGRLFALCRLQRPAQDVVRQIKMRIREVAGTAAELDFHCWLARSAQLSADRGAALDAVRRAETCVRESAGIPFYACNALFALIEAAWDLEDAMSPADRNALNASMTPVRAALSAAARFSRLARAAAGIVEADQLRRSGSVRRAARRLRQSIEIAARFNLRYELALGHYRLAYFPGVAAATAKDSLRRARRLYDAMSVPEPLPR
jgi:hypothetical protein